MNKKKNEIEMEKDITFAEFKAWMNGMIYGRGNNLPDSQDWKLIKQMMDRVVPDKVEIQNPITPWIPPYTPPIDTPPIVPYTTPNTWEPTCSSDSIELTGKLTIGSMSGGDYGCYGQAVGASINPADFAISNESCLPQGSLLPCPVVAVGNTEESPTPALDRARRLLKQFKDAPSEPTNNLFIRDASYELAEILGVKK